MSGQVVPYLQKSIAPFGGWVHFCGDGRGLLDPLLVLPEVKGINFGNPEKFDWNTTMSKFVAADKIYFGAIARSDGETLSDYFVRVLSLLKKKGNLILLADIRGGEDLADALSLWHRLQVRRFS